MALNCGSMYCCAVQQITNLCGYRPTKGDMKKAMQALCYNAFERQMSHYDPVYRKPTKPYSFYVFNGIVAYRKGCKEYKDEARRTANPTLGYVEAFRDFIRDNELGEVVENQPMWNRVNNPHHKILNCVWRPDVIALKKWYAENKPKSVVISG